mmetsp:Transcript_85796/g.228678  ORF Transcript_85796/g.228678 Transcript_85796/m.228678 type:complete len:356 (-) Transcript_85796:4264-5331(-)
MPRHARCDGITAAARRAHGGDEDKVDDLTELQRFPVIPPAVIHPLPQQLNGRLRKVLLARRHVEVVNHDHEARARGRAKDALASLIHLSVEQVLRLVGRSGRRERHGQRVEALAHAVEQLLHDHQGLARARPADRQYMPVHVHQCAQHVRVAQRVHRRHQNRVKGCAWVQLELGPSVHPRQPVGRLDVVQVAIVVQIAGRGQQLLVPRSLGHLPRLGAELAATLEVAARAHGPHQREEEDAAVHVRGRRGLAVVVVSNRLPHLARISRKHAVHEPQHAQHKVAVRRGHGLGQRLADEGDEFWNVCAEERTELLRVGLERLRQRQHPRRAKRQKPQSRRLHVDHAAAAHGRRRRHR